LIKNLTLELPAPEFEFHPEARSNRARSKIKV